MWLQFPCNQFGKEEPGTPQEIRKFVDGYGVKFPMMAKLEVNGDGADPLYKFLKKTTPDSDNVDIEWNFAKVRAATAVLVGKGARLDHCDVCS